MGIGGGYYMICALATALVLIVLYGFMRWERFIDAMSQTRKYRIVCPYEQETLQRYELLFKEFKLQAWKGQQRKVGNEITGNWLVRVR